MDPMYVFLICIHAYLVCSRTTERQTKFIAGYKDGDEPTNAISCGMQCSKDINCTAYKVTENSQKCSLLGTEDTNPSLGHWIYIKVNLTEENVHNSTEEKVNNCCFLFTLNCLGSIEAIEYQPLILVNVDDS